MPLAQLDTVAWPSVKDGARTFAEFFHEFNLMVYRAVLAVVQDRDLANDATAEAFTRAFELWEQVSRHPNPRRWVVRTALNYLTSCHRRYGRERGGELPEHPDPRGNLDRDWALRAALLALPRRQREVVALRYLCDAHPTEIAETLGIDRSTVAVHHHRALHALRAALAEKEPM